MPLYEYGCDACGKTLEIQQKLADAPLVTCPECGKNALRKIISATSFVLKGGGWYKDGYSGNPSGKKPRTENDRADSLQKAIDKDKAKSAESATPSTAPAGGDSSKASG
jgi:putative FmdB family regulatory protein